MWRVGGRVVRGVAGRGVVRAAVDVLGGEGVIDYFFYEILLVIARGLRAVSRLGRHVPFGRGRVVLRKEFCPCVRRRAGRGGHSDYFSSQFDFSLGHHLAAERVTAAAQEHLL